MCVGTSLGFFSCYPVFYQFDFLAPAGDPKSGEEEFVPPLQSIHSEIVNYLISNKKGEHFLPNLWDASKAERGQTRVKVTLLLKKTTKEKEHTR